jgi:putative transcriptional regulator
MRPGLRVKLERTVKDIKQQDLAKQIGISREYLRLIESGKATNPSTTIMKRISAVLDTPVQELFFNE